MRITNYFRNRIRMFWLLIGLLMLLMGAALYKGITVPPPGGDPENIQFNDISNDPIFTSLLPGAKLSGPIVRNKAHYEMPLFDGGGWTGPNIEEDFTSTQPYSTIYQYYMARAAEAGWNNATINGSGTWTKTYPGPGREIICRNPGNGSAVCSTGPVTARLTLSNLSGDNFELGAGD